MPAMILKATLPGDANLDGKVDINDLTIVLASYNQTRMSWNTGDFNNDGKVDINDLTIVLTHYNQSYGSGWRQPFRRARTGCPSALGRRPVWPVRLRLAETKVRNQEGENP